MKKIASLLFAFILSPAILLYAAEQASNTNTASATITATVLDKSTQETIPGAVIELFPVSDTTKKQHFSSAYQGAVKIPGIKYGNYKMRVSYLGYKELEKDVEVNKPTVNLGQLLLEDDAYVINTVVLEGVAMRTSQHGDTLSYKASAFKVTEDADTEALLSKMPGVTVKDGEVEAQGETVKKIYVDGKEFFGEDVNAAIKTLPAEMVDKIEVFNKLSDQAEFTGIDDGESFKAINIVTVAQTSYFGKLQAGYAPDDKYIGSANINVFTGKHRFTVLGSANNMSQQAFSMTDILGTMGGGGGRGYARRGGGSMISAMDGGKMQAQGFGFNYTGQWGNKIDVTGSYFFNNTKRTSESETDRQYNDGSNWMYDATSWSRTRNTEHRFNARLDYKINENHNIMMRPSMTFQNYKTDSENFSETYDFTNELGNLINEVTRTSNSKTWGYNIGNTLIYRARLGKLGRTLTTSIGGSIGKNDQDSYNHNFRRIDLADPATDSLLYQKIKNYSDSYRINGSVMYTEPITKNTQFTTEYRINYNYSDADRKSYLWDEIQNDFDPNFSPEYSNINNSGYLTHRAGPGINYVKDKNKFSASVFYQHSSLTNDQEYPSVRDLKTSFNDITYFSRLETAFNPSTTLRVFASSSTSNPSVTQLQDVVDMSNSQFITAGNPNLNPSYQHRLHGTFIKSSVTKGRTFVAGLSASIYDDYISSVVIRQEGYVLPNGEKLEKGAQFTQYDNMSGRWNVNANFSYGFPVKWLGSNVNFNARTAYAETPSMINFQKNKLKTQTYDGGITIGSNISHNVDFTIGYNTAYNIAENTVRKDNNNKYLTNNFSVRLKLVAWAGITFSTTTMFTQYKGITDDYNDKYWMCNADLGKKVFKNKRGEVSLFVTDLFNEKTNFRRNVTTEYIENVKTNTLGRYWGFKFVYNLRSKRGNGGNSGSGSGSGFRGTPDTGPGSGMGGGRMGGGGHGGPPPGGF